MRPTARTAGSAESLAVVDHSEAWVMHLLPDDTGASAIWGAQRLADGHAAVVPNMFVIREVRAPSAAHVCACAFAYVAC